MKIILLCLYFLTNSIGAFSLTNNEINKICRKEVNKILCVKSLKRKIYILNQGKPIEIQVFPYKK